MNLRVATRTKHHKGGVRRRDVINALEVRPAYEDRDDEVAEVMLLVGLFAIRGVVNRLQVAR